MKCECKWQIIMILHMAYMKGAWYSLCYIKNTSWASEWMSEWASEWVSEWASEQVSEGTSAQIIFCTPPIDNKWLLPKQMILFENENIYV